MRKYLSWVAEFILFLIIACAVSLIATAVIGQTSIKEVLEIMKHLSNV